MDRFFEKADSRLPNYDALLKDLQGIADKTGSNSTSGKWMALQGLLSKMIHNDGKDNSGNSKTEELKSLLKTVRDRYAEGDGTYDSLAKVTESMTPAEREQIDGYYENFKNYFSTTSDEGLDTASIKKSLSKIKEDPAVLKTMLGNNLKEIDRDSIVSLLDANTNIDRSKLESYADRIETELASLRQQYFDGSGTGFKESVENRVREFLDGTERKELRYEALREDFGKALDDPKKSLSILRNRVSKMDGDTVKALLTNNKHISEGNIDQVLSQFESAKRTVSDKFGKIQDEIDSSVENLKRRAVLQAEHARKTTASAAWWLVATAILSALASIAGSAISI